VECYRAWASPKTAYLGFRAPFVFRCITIQDGATAFSQTVRLDKCGVLPRLGKSKNCIYFSLGAAPFLPRGEELLTSYGGAYWFWGVWLDVNGEEGVTTITPAIRSEVQAPARDLVHSM
jgi:hypothetical protein